MVPPWARTVTEKLRHSHAQEAELISDPEALAILEGRNGVSQIDAVTEIVEDYIQKKRPFKLRPSMLLHLHRIALYGISSYAGNYRPAGIEIQGSKHEPVGAHMVPEKIEEMCDYVNENWEKASPLHLAAYVLWRLNWVHPFTDGNGRTARACSYLVLCLRLGHPLYGGNSVPAQIAEDKTPYYDALEAADAACNPDANQLDVEALESLLSVLLTRQLLGVLHNAQGADAAIPH